MNLTIPSDMTPFIQKLLAQGSFRDESEVIIEGLKLLQSREQLRDDVNAGIEQLERGECLDGEEALMRIEEAAQQRLIRRTE